MKRPAHMREFEGDLYDTRRDDWDNRPLRVKYEWHHAKITNGRELCATLRAGEHTWPGCYRLAFATSDGAVLSFAAVRDNLALVMDSVRHKTDDGWRVVGCFNVDESDTAVSCDHTGEVLNIAWSDE